MRTSDWYKYEAEELRVIGESTICLENRNRIFKIAEDWEKLAKWLEENLQDS